jgi:hypothetical protein
MQNCSVGSHPFLVLKKLLTCLHYIFSTSSHYPIFKISQLFFQLRTWGLQFFFTIFLQVVEEDVVL